MNAKYYHNQILGLSQSTISNEEIKAWSELSTYHNLEKQVELATKHISKIPFPVLSINHLRCLRQIFSCTSELHQFGKSPIPMVFLKELATIRSSFKQIEIWSNPEGTNAVVVGLVGQWSWYSYELRDNNITTPPRFDDYAEAVNYGVGLGDKLPTFMVTNHHLIGSWGLESVELDFLSPIAVQSFVSEQKARLEREIKTLEESLQNLNKKSVLYFRGELLLSEILPKNLY